jgi:hypothetical protein
MSRLALDGFLVSFGEVGHVICRLKPAKLIGYEF